MSAHHATTTHHSNTNPNKLTIPQFEPLPPNTLLNRIINKVLAPLYYLLFTIVMSIIVVPIYTVIENIKQGRNSKGGQRFASDESGRRGSGQGQGQGRNKVGQFMKGYSSSFGVAGEEGRGR